MSRPLTAILSELRHFIAHHTGHEPETLKLIFSIADPNEAAAFDAALEIDRLKHYPLIPREGSRFTNSFELDGIKCEIDSPLHREPSRFVLAPPLPFPR